MKNKLLLIGIVFIAFLLRFYQLGHNPPSLTWDEVAFGYNAYAIGIDGKDEFGKFLPLDYLESFGDFKPPMYAYLDILPIKLFGLTAFAVRFPSALLGVLTVLLTYFLVKRIFYSSSHKQLYALVSSLILALSPWHIMLSRGAFEANVATFFLVTGVWAFLASVQEKKWYIVISAIAFVAAMYTFNSARIVAPLLVVALGIIFWKKLWQYKKQTIVAALVGLLFLSPLLPFLFSSQAKLRFQEVNIFSDPALLERSNQEIVNDESAPWSKLLHNRRVVYAQTYLEHYFDHFNPSFLFIRGDENPKFSIQYVGQLYLWDLPFFVIGLLFLIRKREGYWWLIPVWLLIGLIPAGVARETPHALRTEAALPMFQVLVGYGVVMTILFINKSLKKAWVRKSIYTGIVLLLAFNVFYFQYQYYKHYPRRFSGVWQYGYEELIAFLSSNSSYQKVYDSGYWGRPYIYYLFYTKTDPRHFRETMTVTKDRFGFVEVTGFDKYVFTRDMNKEPKTTNTLHVVKDEEVPDQTNTLKIFNSLDGTPEVAVYTY